MSLFVGICAMVCGARSIEEITAKATRLDKNTIFLSAIIITYNLNRFQTFPITSITSFLLMSLLRFPFRIMPSKERRPKRPEKKKPRLK